MLLQLSQFSPLCSPTPAWYPSSLQQSPSKFMSWAVHINSLASPFPILYLFLERGERKEKDREKNSHQCVVATCTPPTGGLACNPGMYSDWESN